MPRIEQKVVVTLPTDLQERLASELDSARRTVEQFMQDATRNYLDTLAWRRQELTVGMAQLDGGLGISHEDVMTAVKAKIDKGRA